MILFTTGSLLGLNFEMIDNTALLCFFYFSNFHSFYKKSRCDQTEGLVGLRKSKDTEMTDELGNAFMMRTNY